MKMPTTLCALVILLSLIAGCQGASAITLSNNRVYSGETFTVTCHYKAGVLLSLAVNAFNATHTGFLWCNIDPVNTTGTGVFFGKNFSSCPVTGSWSTSDSVSLVATPSAELTYSCAVDTYNTTNKSEQRSRSDNVSLFVLVIPSTPVFKPKRLEFNDTDNATVICSSMGGKPVAEIVLTVKAKSGKQLTSHGTESASVMLRLPLADWHQATAECIVRNHNFSNMTAVDLVTINHIFRTTNRAVVYTNSNNETLDCSAYISSYPEAHYSWVFPANNSVVHRSVSDPLFRVLQGDSGPFHCTATNNVTMSSVTIVFTANNNMQWSPNWLSIGIGVGSCMVIIAVILGVVRARGYFSMRCNQKSLRVHNLHKHERTRNKGDDIYMEENPVYCTVPAPPTDGAEDGGSKCGWFPASNTGTERECKNNPHAAEHLAEQD